MANVIKTVITYPLNGSTRDFQIPFEYLARKFVQVTLIGRDRKALVNIQDYRFTSKTQITTNKTWGVGDGYELIELRRFTSATDRLVDFADGSILRAYDLNVSQIQTLHVAEEARDLTADTIGVNNEGHLDARGRRIVNVADPVNALDAVNLKTIKEWNDGAYQSYQNALQQANLANQHRADALASKNAAKTSETNAKTSETNAKTSETNALSSRNSAASSATNASQSAVAASASASQAIEAKDYCLKQADRAYSEAERSKGYADSMGNTIDFGKVTHSVNTDNNAVRWKGNHYLGEISLADGGGGVDKTDRTVLKTVAGTFTISQYADGYWRNLTHPKTNGVIATEEWMRQYVKDGPSASETRLHARDGSDSYIFVRGSDSNTGFFHRGSTKFRVTTTTASLEGGCNRLYINGYDNSTTNRPTIVLDSVADIWRMEPDGAGKFQITHPKSQALYEFVKEGGTQQVASRQWVSSNFSNGTKLGGIVRGTKTNLSEDVKSSEIRSLFSQIPENAVFCGVDVGSTGGFIALTPRWRVIQ